MSSILQALGLDQLPRAERLALVQELWDGLADDSAVPPLTDAQRQELERRLAEDDAAPDDVISWAEVKARTAAPITIMSLPIVFRAAAHGEYDEAAAWYDERQTGLGTQFTGEIESTLEKIATNPDRYPVVLRDVRAAVIRRFPFCVFYRV